VKATSSKDRGISSTGTHSGPLLQPASWTLLGNATSSRPPSNLLSGQGAGLRKVPAAEQFNDDTGTVEVAGFGVPLMKVPILVVPLLL
jgi:hypothetical protein